MCPRVCVCVLVLVVVSLMSVFFVMCVGVGNLPFVWEKLVCNCLLESVATLFGILASGRLAIATADSRFCFFLVAS